MEDSELIGDHTLRWRIAAKVAAARDRFDLSHREADVLAQLILGGTNLQIAEALFLSEKTVKNHLHAIYIRMNVRSRIEAATVTLLHDSG
jgi:DNA-binding NarL/FixJ family response regulator